jgi:hypothetical protein
MNKFEGRCIYVNLKTKYIILNVSSCLDYDDQVKFLRFYSHSLTRKLLSHLEKMKQKVASESRILLTRERVKINY